MIRLEILRKKGYKLTYARDKITATRGNKVYEAHNLTKLFNNVKNDNYIKEEKQVDESIIDSMNLEQFFNKQKS
jgi:hypothetical protein